MKDRPRFRRVVTLLTLLAVLTSLFLVVNVTPVAAQTAVTGVTAAPAPVAQSTAAAYTVGFTTSVAGPGVAIGDVINITFPAGTTVPATVAAAEVTVNTTACTVAATGAAQVLTVTSPVVVAANTAVTVVIGVTTTPITNPPQGSYTLDVDTTGDITPATSTAYTIGGDVALNAADGLATILVQQTVYVTNDVNGDNWPDAVGLGDPLSLRALSPGVPVTVKFDRTAVGYPAAATMTTTPATVTASLPVTIAPASPGGCFRASFEIPQVPTSVLGAPAAYTVWVTDGILATATNPAGNTIGRILPSIALLVGGVVVATPGGSTTQSAGTTITAAGAGFEANVAVTVYENVAARTAPPGAHASATDPVVASGTADATGTFLTTFTASSATDGQLYARDSSALGNESGLTSPLMDVTLNLRPGVSVSPATGRTMTTVTATGTNYTAASPPWISPTWNGLGAITVGTLNVAATAVTACTLLTPNTSFTITFQIPAAAATGVNVIQVTDSTGVVGQGTFTVDPRALSVTPNTGPPGTTVMVSGANMTAGSTILAANLLFAGAAWPGAPATISIDALGNITPTTLTVPGATLGTHEVKATDGSSAVAIGSFTVTEAGLILSPDSGPRGTRITVSGANMTTGGAATIPTGSLTLGGLPWNTAVMLPTGTPAGTISIDTAGNIIPATLRVLNTAVWGVNEVAATDTSALRSAGTFTVTRPTISVSPGEGYVGTLVTVTGAGWLPGMDGLVSVQVDIAGTPTTLLVSTPDANGDFMAQFTMPVGIGTGPGSTMVRASDSITLGNSAEPQVFSIKVAAITVEPTSGAVGDTITVTGVGFQPQTSVSALGFGIPGALPPAPVPPVITDTEGAFSASFLVPGLATGAQTITARVATVNATTSFSIGEAPPTVASAMTSISAQLIRVWGYAAGVWEMYDPADVPGSDLAALTAGRGYWVKVTEDVTLIFGGNTYDLTAPWYLLGWR